MIAGDTKIFLLSNLKEPTTLAELHAKGGYPFPIFTTTDHVTVGWLDRIVPLGQTRVLKVTLDDGTSFKATPEQKIILLDGARVRVDYLSEGKSLRPLYLSRKQNYPMFEEISDYNLKAVVSMDCQKVRKVARMVGEFKHGERLPPGTKVSHIDGDKENCHPSNLDVSINPGARQRKFVHPFAKSLKDAIEFINQQPRNHKVVSVSDAGTDFVYGCVSVQTDNLALGGVFFGTIEDE